jgi:hypothetical protein
MDTRIPLGVQGIDFAGSMMNGLAAGTAALDAQQQNALMQLYRQQGPQIMAGDPNALNSLAQFDPNAAMGVQQNQLGMQQTRQNMAFDAEKMGMLRAQAKAETAAAAQKVSAAELEAEAEQMRRTMAGAAPYLLAWKQGDQAAGQQLVSILAQNGIQATPETLEATIYALQGGYEGIMDGIAAQKAMQDLQPKPAAPADEYQRYVQEETTAGRKPLTRLEFSAADRAPATGLTVTTNPDGTTTIVQGPTGAATPGTMTVDPRAIGTVTQAIDAIINDPALNKVVGPIEGGGGNNVDDLGATARMYYGGDGLALIQRINQLQSTTWLAARQMLKGGGAITDYESKKAEAAMSRLSRAQGEDEFKAALKDLRDAVTEGQAKLQAANGGQPATEQPAAQPGVDFSAMDVPALSQVDVMTLDEKQLGAFMARMKELGQ